jgi:hypothetical protein
MSNKWRRFEVLLPRRHNDGRSVPPEWIGEATLEIVERFGAASYETQAIEGTWRHGGLTYQDELAKVVIDVPDTAKNRKWMKDFKARWKKKLEQLELWLVSYRIDVD